MRDVDSSPCLMVDPPTSPGAGLDRTRVHPEVIRSTLGMDRHARRHRHRCPAELGGRSGSLSRLRQCRSTILAFGVTLRVARRPSAS